MIRHAERPRVAALLAVLGVLAAVLIAAGGVMAGKASVNDRPTMAQLEHANAAAAAAKREVATLKTTLGTRVSELEASRARAIKRMHRAERSLRSWRARTQRAVTRAKAWRARTQRAEARARRWRARALRAEGRARARTARQRSSR